MTSGELPALPVDSVYCSLTAATRYGIPSHLMLAVAEAEGGVSGVWRRNLNGTSDVGAMQFNTTYLAELSKYGITPQAVSMPGCYPFHLAAWRLQRHLRLDRGDIWQRAANYHSRTLRYNARYRLVLITKGTRWGHWLDRCAASSCLGLLTSQGTGTTGAYAAPQPTTQAPGYIPQQISVSAPR